jgi:hypothetical protein
MENPILSGIILILMLFLIITNIYLFKENFDIENEKKTGSEVCMSKNDLFNIESQNVFLKHKLRVCGCE